MYTAVRINGRLRAVYTGRVHVYTSRTRLWTRPCTVEYTAVNTAVYMVVYTAVHTAVYIAVYTACTWRV